MHIKMIAIHLTVCWCMAMLSVSADTKASVAPGRIYVQKKQFMVDGHPIYLNGINTPFHIWDEFGNTGRLGYDPDWWETEFRRMKAVGINSTRIWISCSGTSLPRITPYGYVIGVNQQFWRDVDHLMELARIHQIYVMATMMSFDHVKEKKNSDDPQLHFLRWRQMFTSKDRIQSMIDKYLLPFVRRYKDNPHLYAIDLCNEPEWMNQNKKCGRIPWDQLQQWGAMSSAAIHKSGSKVLVTIGSAGVKWNSPAYEANRWSNKALQAQFPDKNAYMDFYQLHWYLWMERWQPLLTPTWTHRLTDRPVVLGELPASNLKLPPGTTLAETFEFLFKNGYSGHYPWTSNGIDKNGSLVDVGPSAKAFQRAHPKMVRVTP